MTPRKLVEWGMALTAVVLMLMFILTLGDDLFLIHDFPRLRRFLEIEIMRPIFLVAIAGAIASFVTFLLRATRGTLEFKALGIKFTGPSGPVLLWVSRCLPVPLNPEIRNRFQDNNPSQPVSHW